MNPENSDDSPGTEVCHWRMIRQVNADGEPVTAWYAGPDNVARPPCREEDGPGRPQFP